MPDKPITARELIEILERADEDAEIVIDWDDLQDPIRIVEARITHPEQVFLKNELW